MTRGLLTVLGIMAILMITACDQGLTGQAIGEKTAALEAADEEITRVSQVLGHLRDVHYRSEAFEGSLTQANDTFEDVVSLAGRLMNENTANADVLEQITELQRTLTEDIRPAVIILAQNWDEKVGVLLDISDQHLAHVISVIRGEEASEGSPVTEAEISALIGRLDAFVWELVDLQAVSYTHLTLPTKA